MVALQLAAGLCLPSQTPLAPVTGAFPLPVKPLALPLIAAHCLFPVAVGLCLPSQTPRAPVTDAFPLPVNPLTLPIAAAHCFVALPDDKPLWQQSIVFPFR